MDEKHKCFYMVHSVEEKNTVMGFWLSGEDDRDIYLHTYWSTWVQVLVLLSILGS